MVKFVGVNGVNPKANSESFSELTDFPNLLKAANKAFKRKRYKPRVSEFYFNLEKELFKLQQELESKTYKPSPYHYFVLKEMKTRIISAAAFRDRVVHHALLNVIESIFEKDFIPESYACRKGKGTHKAIELTQKDVNSYEYYMKCDIDKYFANIDHKVLMDIIKEKIIDKDILWLCQIILDNAVKLSPTLSLSKARESCSRISAIAKVGIPVGNLTSQFFANVYLDILDHFVKDQLNISAYIRYMDDFLIFSDSKKSLHIYLAKINDFLNKKLKLKIKDHERIIAPFSEGIPFLGFRIYRDLIRIKNKNLHRTTKRLNIRLKEYERGKIDLEKLGNSFESINGHLKHGNTLKLRREIISKLPEIYNCQVY